MADSIKIGLRIVNPGKQGLPSYPLPYRNLPRRIDRIKGGAAFNDDGSVMAREVELSFSMETLNRSFSAKYGATTPMNAIASQLEFVHTEVPQVSMQGLLFSAHAFREFGATDTGSGARLLSRLLDWLEFCTYPWTGFGRGPLLQLVVGARSEFVYIEKFDPKVESFMPSKDPQVALLPYEVSASLAFKRELLGAAVLEKRDLPTSRNLQGGTGGLIDPKGT